MVPFMLYCEVVTGQGLGHRDPKSEDFPSSDRLNYRGLSTVEKKTQGAAGKVERCANSKDRTSQQPWPGHWTCGRPGGKLCSHEE